MSHGNAVRVATSTTADGNNSAHAFGEEHAGSQTQHATHTGADAGVKLVDSKMVKQPELSALHVFHCQDGKPRCVALAVCRVDRRGASRTVAATNDVGTDDKVLVSIQRLPGAYELLPPARLRVGLSAVSMTGC